MVRAATQTGYLVNNRSSAARLRSIGVSLLDIAREVERVELPYADLFISEEARREYERSLQIENLCTGSRRLQRSQKSTP